jgi:hypothetical protein
MMSGSAGTRGGKEMNSVTSMRAAKTGGKLVTVSSYTTAAVVCRDAAGTGTGFGITGTGGNFATDNFFPSTY